MKFKLLREGVERDSLGNVLSDEQVKYFKNSKIRDRQGRLLVVHHGTFSSFNQFDKGDIGFHFGTEKAAKERQDFTDPDRIIKKEWRIGQYYLNITNFLDMYDIGDWDGSNLASHIIESRLLPLTDEEIRYLQQIQMMGGLGMGRNHDPTLMLREFLLKKGIDGIMYENAYEDDGSISYVALNPEQIKSITNKTPTNSKRIDEGTSTNDTPDINEVENLFLRLGFDKGGVINHSAFIFPDGKTFYNNTHEDFYIELCDRGMIKDYYEDFIVTKFNCIRCCDIDGYEHYIEIPQNITPRQMRALSDWLDHSEETYGYKIIQLCSRNNGFEEKVYDLGKLRKDGEDAVKYILDRVKRCVSSGVLYEDLPDMSFDKFEDGLLEEDKIVNNTVNKKLTESLQRLASNAFITDSPYQIRDLLINKPKLYRILYDSNIDMYMIGDGNEVIHWDLIRAARKLGYYAEMESFIDELGDLDNYVEFGGGGQFLDDEEIESYLIYMVFSPDDEEFILGEDGYQFKYPLSQGVMFTRDSYLEDCDLYRVLKSMMPVSLTEARKDFSDKYPSVDEAQEYINNNYSTDTLPPTGATFLMPNGLFIDLGASHMTVHQEFDEQVYNDLVEGGDYVGEFGYTDLFLPRLGFIRCNDGTTMGSLLVHLPSQKPTREQYEALEGWLDASLSMDMYNYIIIATDKSTKRYDTGDYMTDELIALIKRYYASGRLYEDSTNTIYYRYELKDAFGDNCGGLFNSKALWNLIYSNDDDDECAEELEELIDTLQDDHTVPTEWLGDNVKFAFKKSFVDRHTREINRIDDLLKEFSHSLVVVKVCPTHIVFEDDNQIAYIDNLKEATEKDNVDKQKSSENVPTEEEKPSPEDKAQEIKDNIKVSLTENS